MSAPPVANVDIVIVGGGIAGLWLLNDLRNRGYSALLLEAAALGAGQTMASQGMIHGGIKYSLAGALSGASEAIAEMPDHWRHCLRGAGAVDLRRARVLSDHFYLWSTGAVAGRTLAFLASKTVRGRVDPVAAGERPPIFAATGFSGSLYRLVDLVLDVPSLAAALADNCADAIFSLAGAATAWDCTAAGRLVLDLETATGTQRLAPAAFVFAAGAGNAGLMAAIGATAPAMQRRPLHQVMVRHRYPHALHGHCLGRETTPRLTISSHPAGDGEQVWYLGGTLAEQGVGMEPDALIALARQELAALLPWVDLGPARWATLAVERAEPRQPRLLRPDQAFADWTGNGANALVAWPTKLTLCPHLADRVAERLAQRGIAPSGTSVPVLPLPRPPLAPTPWETAFGA
jgi:glycerol-3-phosphate dehydrogenase